jgi:hypothetical protein
MLPPPPAVFWLDFTPLGWLGSLLQSYDKFPKGLGSPFMSLNHLKYEAQEHLIFAQVFLQIAVYFTEHPPS